MATPTSKKTERYFITLAYNGAPFHGWQRQPDRPTVQQTLEEALATILRTPLIPITGAGRTDTGVSATHMVAHLDLPSLLTPPEEAQLIRSLNGLLRPYIAIYNIRHVHPDAHARFDATARTYHYHAHTIPSPFIGPTSWLAPPRLDFPAMNEAARTLLGTQDFTSFSKLHTDVKTNICTITHAAWHTATPSDIEARIAANCPYLGTNSSQYIFSITADRFLRNMVRAIVGTLVEVGRHKISIPQFRDIINQKNRCAAGTSMPPGPLFLHDIQYPY